MRKSAGDPKFDALLSSAEQDGFDPEQLGNAVVVGVNHKGEPYILQGKAHVLQWHHSLVSQLFC